MEYLYYPFYAVRHGSTLVIFNRLPSPDFSSSSPLSGSNLDQSHACCEHEFDESFFFLNLYEMPAPIGGRELHTKRIAGFGEKIRPSPKSPETARDFSPLQLPVISSQPCFCQSWLPALTVKLKPFISQGICTGNINLSMGSKTIKGSATM